MSKPKAPVGWRTVLVLEFAEKWARVQNMTKADGEASSYFYSFQIFEREHPDLAALAKKIQFETFDRVNAL